MLALIDSPFGAGILVLAGGGWLLYKAIRGWTPRFVTPSPLTRGIAGAAGTAGILIGALALYVLFLGNPFQPHPSLTVSNDASNLILVVRDIPPPYDIEGAKAESVTQVDRNRWQIMLPVRSFASTDAEIEILPRHGVDGHLYSWHVYVREGRPRIDDPSKDDRVIPGPPLADVQQRLRPVLVATDEQVRQREMPLVTSSEEVPAHELRLAA